MIAEAHPGCANTFPYLPPEVDQLINFYPWRNGSVNDPNLKELAKRAVLIKGPAAPAYERDRECVDKIHEHLKGTCFIDMGSWYWNSLPLNYILNLFSLMF